MSVAWRTPACNKACMTPPTPPPMSSNVEQCQSVNPLRLQRLHEQAAALCQTLLVVALHLVADTLWIEAALNTLALAMGRRHRIFSFASGSGSLCDSPGIQSRWSHV